MKRLQRGGHRILNPAWRKTRRKQSKDSASNGFGIYAWIAIHRFVNASAQRVEALRGPMHAGMPTFIIETAQQWRQLCAEIDHLVAWHHIAKSVERADQGGIGLVAIPPVQALRQIVDPALRFSDGAAEFLYLSHLTTCCPSVNAIIFGDAGQRVLR